MRARAKSTSMPYPIWVQGKYLTGPSINGLKYPTRHYINTGGYLDSDVCEIDIDTLCQYTGISDRNKCMVFENDILLHEVNQTISYFIIQSKKAAVDIINGEILEVKKLSINEIKVIGNTIDFPDFTEGIRHFVDTGRKIPYLPVLDVLETSYPFFKLTCFKCRCVFLSCKYMAKHKKCGEYLEIDFASEVH